MVRLGGLCGGEVEYVWVDVRREMGQVKRILLQSGDTDLLHKELLSDRWFLVCVTRIYPPCTLSEGVQFDHRNVEGKQRCHRVETQGN